MKSPNSYKQAGQSVFMSSIMGLANTLAVAVTFFGVPPLYNKTVPYVQSFTANYYGYGLEDIVALCWFGICACTVFFLSRGSISVALMMGGTAFAIRFLS